MIKEKNGERTSYFMNVSIATHLWVRIFGKFSNFPIFPLFDFRLVFIHKGVDYDTLLILSRVLLISITISFLSFILL